MVIRKQVKHLYEFGPFILDVAERRLICHGKVIALAPKVLDTLIVLIENNDRVMEKEELLKALWPNTYVEESNLTTYVSQLRKALGENVDGQSYIETVPRRGYRFVANVRTSCRDVEQLVILERTDTRILTEEEITNDEPIVDGQPMIHQQPVSPHKENATISYKPLIKRSKVSNLLVTSVTLTLIAVGIYFLMGRFSSSQKSASSHQQMSISRMTTNGKIPLATISPDGKYIAHVVQDTQSQSLWVRQSNTTSNMQIISPAPVHFLSPTYSPDGNFIYYITYQDGLGSLYQVPALGGTPRKIIEEVDSPITFSPNSQKIAFFRNNSKTKEGSLIVANPDGTNQITIITRKSQRNFSQDYYGYFSPSWSPDGGSIATAVTNEDAGVMSFQLVAINLEDKSINPISNHKWHWLGQVAWMPDGKGLIANALEQGTSFVANQIWHIDFQTGVASRITNDFNSYKGISIAAKTGAIVTIQSAQVSRLWVMPTGKEIDAIPITSGFGEYYSEFLGVDWTKDDRIVYGSNASGNADIWIMDRDGKNQKQLTTNTDKDMTPIASPDGKYIVYISFQGNLPHVARMDIDGSNQKQLTNGKGEVAPTFSADGQWIAFTDFDGINHRIKKVPIDGGTPIQVTEINHVRSEFSPDGKWLACLVINPENNSRKITIIPANGGAPVTIFEKLPFQRWSYLRWMSDSSALTLAGVQDGVSNIYKLPKEGGGTIPITNYKSDWIYRYAWAKDGKSLAVERGIPINDVIMISDLK